MAATITVRDLVNGGGVQRVIVSASGPQGPVGPSGTSDVTVYADFASFPTASSAGNGAQAMADDTNQVYISDGTNWLEYAIPSTATELSWSGVNNFDASVRFRKDPHIDPRHPDFGLVGDGVADDSPALAAISAEFASGSSSGTTPFKLRWPPGAIVRMTETWEIKRAGAVISGWGIGNPKDYATNPGDSSILRWDGPVGVPMIKVQDSRYVHMQDFRLQGHNTNTPSAGINYHNDGVLDGHGTNAQLSLSRILFGRWAWGSAEHELDRCILFDGTNANNDEFHFSLCSFEHPNIACVELQNSQSLWGKIDHCRFAGNAAAKGLVTAASILLDTCTFQNCTVDIEASGSADVTLYGYFSENAARWVWLKDLSRLRAWGGLADITSTVFNAENNFIKVDRYNPDSLLIDGVKILNKTGGGTRPKIHVRSDTGASVAGTVSNLELRGMLGLKPGDLDVQATNGDRPIRVVVQVGGPTADHMNVNRTIKATQALDLTVYRDDGAKVVSADNGDAAKTLTTSVHEPIQRWATDLTADRAVTLATTFARNGHRFTIHRTGAGAFNLNVGSGPLKALAQNEWCEVVFDGSAWILERFGSL